MSRTKGKHICDNSLPCLFIYLLNKGFLSSCCLHNFVLASGTGFLEVLVFVSLKITAVITHTQEFTKSCYHTYHLNKKNILLKKAAGKKT